jgi:hypothetical protein
MSGITTFIDLKEIEAPEIKNILKRVVLKKERLEDIGPLLCSPKQYIRPKKCPLKHIRSVSDQGLPVNSLFTFPTGYFRSVSVCSFFVVDRTIYVLVLKEYNL